MGCHPKALARIDAAIVAALRAGRLGHVDHYLDQRYDALNRASEWDADAWGFDPTRWMEAERVELVERADGQTWPTEPVTSHGRT